MVDSGIVSVPGDANRKPVLVGPAARLVWREPDRPHPLQDAILEDGNGLMANQPEGTWQSLTNDAAQRDIHIHPVRGWRMPQRTGRQISVIPRVCPFATTAVKRI